MVIPSIDSGGTLFLVGSSALSRPTYSAVAGLITAVARAARNFYLARLNGPAVSCEACAASPQKHRAHADDAIIADVRGESGGSVATGKKRTDMPVALCRVYCSALFV